MLPASLLPARHGGSDHSVSASQPPANIAGEFMEASGMTTGGRARGDSERLRRSQHQRQMERSRVRARFQAEQWKHLNEVVINVEKWKRIPSCVVR